MSETRIETFVAPLLRSNGKPILDPEGKPICWFDRFLYGGGLLKPAGLGGKPAVMLCAGPPGAGKSVLTQQIAFNRALEHIRPDLTPGIQQAHATSLVILTETKPRAVFENMTRLGFVNQASGNGSSARFGTFDELLQSGQFAMEPECTPLMVFVDASEHEYADAPTGTVSQKPTKTEKQVDRIVARIESLVLGSESGAKGRNPERSAWDKARGACERRSAPLLDPTLVIVDSLNILADVDDRHKLVHRLCKGFTGRAEFLVLILDTVDGFDLSHFEVDVVLRLDTESLDGAYLTRQVTLSKTRFQGHTLGRQFAKLLGAPWLGLQARSAGSSFGPVFADNEDALKTQIPQRANSADWVIEPNLATDPEGPRPNLKRGGFFVFPSLHYVLSVVRSGTKLVSTTPKGIPADMGRPMEYAKGEWAPCGSGPLACQPERHVSPGGSESSTAGTSRAPAAPALNWPVRGCFELAGGGIPLNRTVALVGRRGARTSYFAYQFLLDGVKNGEKTVLLSFMDAPDGVRAALSELSNAYESLAITDDNPIIIHQRPGYVAPEEWFHRVITAVGEHSPTRVALVAVDQWESGHPLLWNSPILLPTLMDFLSVHEVTSMIAAIDLNRADLSRCGLTAKASVVLSFEHRRIPWQDPPADPIPSKGTGIDWFARDVPLLVLDSRPRAHRTKLVVKAVRVGRGAPGYGRAILDFHDDGPGRGSIMRPLSPDYPEGTRV